MVFFCFFTIRRTHFNKRQKKSEIQDANVVVKFIITPANEKIIIFKTS
jgi:hypothetical protein